MADLLLLAVYAIGLPAFGALAAMATACVSWSAATEAMEATAKRRMMPRLLVLAVELPVVPVLFGVVLYVLLLGRTDRPSAQLEWATLSSGVPGMLTGFAFAIVLHRGVAHSVSVPGAFGRVAVLAALPQTLALFGFSMAFLILGRTSADPALVVEASRTAALYMIAGSLVAPVEAYAMVATWRFESLERWKRALVIAALLESLVLVAYASAFFALGPFR